MTLDTNMEFESWRHWFAGVDQALLSTYFGRWQDMLARSQRMQEAITISRMMPDTQQAIALATAKLDYESPYRIVVLGESGAGKSSTINALLGQNRLAMGSGGAITGVPVYVHPIETEESESIIVEYRSNASFHRLLKGIGDRFGLELPLELADLEQQLDQILTDSTVPSENILQLETDLKDIVGAWNRLSERNMLGTSKHFHPDSDREHVQQLMEERSPLNALNSETRIISGIAKIDYRLHVHADHRRNASLQSNIVLIDTPGIGARTLRHQEILQEEVQDADAVILVANARRPEDKTASMAYLLGQALLSSFSPEQKDYFAQKVFLVVNQIDAIQNADDRRRLEDSIVELCGIIAPNFWVTHVASEVDSRYFETMAELAILAQAKTDGRNLDDSKEALYRAYAEQFLDETQKESPECHRIAMDVSNVSGLRAKLSEWLGERRLELMLHEAAVMLDRVVDVAETECHEFLAKYGLESDDSLSPDIVNDRNVRQICEKQLEQDRRDLLENFGHMLDSMQTWRTSDAYRQSLESQVGEICADLDRDIVRWLTTALSENSRYVTTRDTTTGIVYTEIATVRFVADAERMLRQLVERQGINLAEYYLDQLDEFIHHNRIYERLEEAAYAQPYIAANPPVIGIKETEGSIRNEFAEICRWVPVYELMKSPLIASGRKRDSIEPAVALEVSNIIVGLAMASFDVTGQAPAAAASATPGLWKGFVTKAQTVWAEMENAEPMKPTGVTEAMNPSTQSTTQKLSDELEVLRQNIVSALNSSEIDQVKKLVGQQLSARSKQALGDSLPYLDMLFFYQMEKHDAKYREVVDDQYHRHINQVLDRNPTIRQIIVRRNQAVLAEATDLINILTDLRAA